MTIKWSDFHNLTEQEITDKVSSLNEVDRYTLSELLHDVVADSLTRDYSDNDGFIMDVLSGLLWD